MWPRHAALWPIGAAQDAGPGTVWDDADPVLDVRSGIDRREFIPFYQPVVALDTGRLLGFECLARWRHPALGLLGPERFIPAAEESGAVGGLSYALLARAVRDARAWPAPLRFSINISPVQLQDPDLPLHLLRRLHEGGIEPGRLTVELTESRPVADMAMARRALASLRSAGIKVVLDDFGSGSAGLLSLYQLSFDGLKVDRSFLAALGSADGRMVLRAILDLATQLGMTTLIEGVESREQAGQLWDLGFERAQGFLFGRPMPAAAAARMIASGGLKRLGVR
jgi:EAL domain-containing protein (putative c-di-GMP-specific phosphodiesterase class I)